MPDICAGSVDTNILPYGFHPPLVKFGVSNPLSFPTEVEPDLTAKEDQICNRSFHRDNAICYNVHFCVCVPWNKCFPSMHSLVLLPHNCYFELYIDCH